MTSEHSTNTNSHKEQFDAHRPGIDVLAKSMPVTTENIRSFYPEGPVVVCDIYVEGVELGQAIAGGYAKDNIINIDHHSPADRMVGLISSAPLAIEYVNEHGVIDPSIPIVTNHLDCDSVLSTAIMRGIIPPENVFAEAAIAADHTGEQNDIADLLQSIQHLSENGLGINYSIENLLKLLGGERLGNEVVAEIQKRQTTREKIRRAIRDNQIGRVGLVGCYITVSKIDAGLLPAELPELSIIVVANPVFDENGTDVTRWNNSLRLGQAGIANKLNLHSLGITDFDPNFGGRWNAGSNKRAGGTQISPTNYAYLLDQRLPRSTAA